MEPVAGLPPTYVAFMDAREAVAVARSDLARRRALEDAIDTERDAVAALEADLTREQADVEALESFGLRSVLARLRGRLDEELSAEQAEVEAVRLEVGVRRQALADLEAASGRVGVAGHESLVHQAERAEVEARARWEAEQVAVESSTGLRLADLDDAHTHLVARLREVDEARAAAADATRALEIAGRELSGAANWSTYDTFFGGGIISSLAKHGRVDGAASAIAGAQAALVRLHAELADLRDPASPVVDLASPTLRAVDVWFDNMLSDWMVHRRIKASQQSVASSAASVRETATGLDAHRRDVEAELERLAEERVSLLLEPPVG